MYCEDVVESSLVNCKVFTSVDKLLFPSKPLYIFNDPVRIAYFSSRFLKAWYFDILKIDNNSTVVLHISVWWD